MKNGPRFVLCIISFSMLVLLLLPDAGFAQMKKNSDPDYIFYKGNTLYEAGKYDEAIREYSKLIEQSFESGNIYYNIGNCYFKKGDIGRTILNYERAKKLIPGDSDLVSNYSFTRSFIKADVSKASTPWFKSIFNSFNFLTINGLTVFLSVIFTFTVFFLLSGLFITPLKRYRRFVLPVLLIIFMAGAFSLYSRVSMLGKEAVIISESVDAKFEPLDNATTYFSMYAGMKVYILESKEDWSKVERFDGKVGWIMSSNMDRI
ncbi:MAG TPA: tetratricopeptide repeat protein [Nitrospirae bacterium]|nr:tetratricopeptide repeat protein [bacterium BMS3Bbin09]HDH10998.1 tetratricopeptide repeat protein [Nitrospirota bacterium]